MNYFAKNEEEDIKKFQIWWAAHRLQYPTSARTEQYARVDAFMMNTTGGCYSIELKCRSKRYGKDCFIEPDKYKIMMDLWNIQKIMPLYINFYDDCIYMWNLAQIRNKKIHSNVKIWDNGKETIKYEDRYGLYYSDAFKFDLDGKLIRSPYKKHINDVVHPEYQGEDFFKNKLNNDFINRLINGERENNSEIKL